MATYARPDPAPAAAAAYALKAALPDPDAVSWRLKAQKTMYGGKHIAAGDMVYLFESEHSGGRGLIARGIVRSAQACPRRPDLPRQTPRVSLTVDRQARARQPLGRAQLRPFDQWDDGQPETELNFKLYRQATDKLVGLSEAAAGRLAACFADTDE
ncbi:MAG TPA: hypothetical protein VK195_04235 [Burkholderiaceae bacterium]|nr:hypothetical protein [Burkholderiaceae bacterium]